MAVDESFGGFTNYNKGWGASFLKSHSAYMLVYLRKSEIAAIQKRGALEAKEEKAESLEQKAKARKEGEEGSEEKEKDTDAEMSRDPRARPLFVAAPAHLVERFRREEEEYRKAKELAAKAHLYTELKLSVEFELVGQSTGLETLKEEVDEQGVVKHTSIEKKIKVEKAGTLLQWASDAAKQYSIPPERQQFWYLTTRTNETIRPNQWLAGANKPFTDIFSNPNKGANRDRLFLRDNQFDALFPGGKTIFCFVIVWF